MFCTKCGHERQANEQFCPVCGTPYPSIQESPLPPEENTVSMPSPIHDRPKTNYSKLLQVVLLIALCLLIGYGAIYKVRHPGISNGETLACHNNAGLKELSLEQIRYLSLNRLTLDQIAKLSEKWGFRDLGEFVKLDNGTDLFGSGDYSIRGSNLHLDDNNNGGFAFSVMKTSEKYYVITIRTTDIDYINYFIDDLTDHGKKQLREISPDEEGKNTDGFGTIEYNDKGSVINVRGKEYSFRAAWDDSTEGFYYMYIAMLNGKFI